MERYKLKLKRKKNIISLRGGGGVGQFPKTIQQKLLKRKIEKGEPWWKKKEKVEEVLSSNQVLC